MKLSKLHLRKILWDLKKSPLREDRRPSEGVWYFIWLKPKWVLEAYKFTEYGDSFGQLHSTLWEKYLADKVGNHYGIDPDEIYGMDSLRNASSGMPRGRVALTDSGWALYHGNDTPIPFDKAKTILLNAFELSQFNNRFEYDDHEIMTPEDQETIQEAIGHVPYKGSKQMRIRV